MDNPTRPLRGNRRPAARAITVAAALLLLLGLATPASPAPPGQGIHSSAIRVTDPSRISPAVTGPQGQGSHTVLVWDLAPDDQSRAAAPQHPSQEPEGGQGTTEGTKTDSDEGHRFLSPGLLGLAALVAVTALVGAYLSIRSRRRSRKSKETEE